MTAAVMHNLASFSTISQVGLSSDPRTVKHKRPNEESLYQESPSTFSQISSETCTSRIGSRSLNNDYDSCSSLSELKTGKLDRNSKITDRESDTTKCSSSGMPVARKSRVNPCLTRTESAASDHDLGSRDKSSLTPRDKISDLQANRNTSGSGELVQDRAVSSVCSKYSCNISKTSFQPEKDNNHLYDQNKQVSLAKLESRLENYDFPEMKQSYNSKLTSDNERKGVNENQSRTTISSAHLSTNGINSNVSEMKLKLRGSMESEFLCNELRELGSIKLETCIEHAKETFRSIDEILRDYGISNDVPSSQYKSSAYKNLSQNNETSQVSEISNPEKNGSTKAMRPRAELSQSMMMMSSTTTISPMSKGSRINSSVYLDNRNPATPTAAYKSNVSQNNETKYGRSHEDLLRRYGSSVDYTSIAAGGKYSTRKHYGRYDYGKSTFSGDVASGTQPGYTNKTVQDFEVKKSDLLSRRLEGSQVDILKPGSIAAIKEEEYNSIRHTGSSIDAVEFTITSERQRLRKLNNMITSTSVTTSDGSSHKNLMTRYLSPQRDYDTLRASNALSKVYSSPTFPSSHYGASLTPKGSWADNVGHHESSIYLGKSASAPNTWSNGFQTFTNYSTSFDTRSPYLPHYSSRGLNRQFNNSTRSFSLERLVSQINSSQNQSRAFLNIKQEIPVRRKNKHSFLMHTELKNYNQSRCPLQNTSNISMFSLKSDNSCTTSTSGCKKSVCMKKMPNRNTNDSKSTSEVYGTLGNQKSVNKPWQSSRLTKTTVGKSGHKHNVSNYPPYGSNCVSQVRKVETFHNLAKELFKHDSNQSSTNSKQKRTPSRKVNNNNSVGNPRQSCEYRREPDLVPAWKSQGRRSVHSSRTSHETNKRILRAVEKNKATIASEILIQKTTAMPWSAHVRHNHAPTNMASAYRPHSNVAAPSRSHPHFPTPLPYHVYRDYSTINLYTSRPSYY